MNAEGPSGGQHGVMTHAAQDLIGLGLIVVDALAVAPAMRGEIESHHVVLFAIGRRTGGAGVPSVFIDQAK